MLFSVMSVYIFMIFLSSVLDVFVILCGFCSSTF